MLSGIYLFGSQSSGMKNRMNWHCNALIAASLFISLSAVIGQANALPVTLTGQVTSAGNSYTIAQLQALGNTTGTVGGNTYVGVSLWSLLAGIINDGSGWDDSVKAAES